MVVIWPLSRPNSSTSTLTGGARPLVVQEAFEMTLCFAGSYFSSLTPRTMVTSSFVAGALMITFLTLSWRWARGLRAVGEEAGRLDDDLDAGVAPGDLRRVALGEDLDRLAVDDEAAVAGLRRRR